MRRGEISILVKREQQQQQVFSSFGKDFERRFELRRKEREREKETTFVWREKKGIFLR